MSETRGANNIRIRKKDKPAQYNMGKNSSPIVKAVPKSGCRKVKTMGIKTKPVAFKNTKKRFI